MPRASRKQQSHSQDASAAQDAAKYIGIDPAIVREEQDSKPDKRGDSNAVGRQMMDHHHVANPNQQGQVGVGPMGGHPGGPGQQVQGLGQLGQPGGGPGGPGSQDAHPGHYLGQQYMASAQADPRSMASAAYMPMGAPDHNGSQHHQQQPHLQHGGHPGAMGGGGPHGGQHQHQLQHQHQHQMPMQQQQQQQQLMAAQASGNPNTQSPVGGADQQQMGGGPGGPFMPNSERLTNTTSMGKRRVRLGWTKEETDALLDGCRRHGVGNWKKILTDPTYRFNNRTAVDLKDRFRTSFPEEYARLYPNAKTHKMRRRVVAGPGGSSSSSNRQNSQSLVAASNSAGAAVPGSRAEDWQNAGIPGQLMDAHAQGNGANGRGGGGIDETLQLVKINRKERRAFSQAEDARLLEGFRKHGPAWSKIQRDPALNFAERRSTDLRDRFRNAFPEQYAKAGYKGRTRRSTNGAVSLGQDSMGSQGVGSRGPSRGMSGAIDMTETMIKDDPGAAMAGVPYMGHPTHAAPQQYHQFPQAMYYAQQPHMPLYRGDHT